VQYDNGNITEFDTSCFSGEYVTGDVTVEYLREVEALRSDKAKNAREQARRNRHSVNGGDVGPTAGVA
jgi:amidophosphoribosyltransferase